MLLYVFQGPVYFDENGTREESRLYIFQYYNGRTYTNGTQTRIDRVHNGDLSYKLSLIPVAYIETDSEDLIFVGEGKHRLWSGKQYFLSQRTTLKSAIDSNGVPHARTYVSHEGT